MTQYTMICLILYLLTILGSVVALLPHDISCDFRVSSCPENSTCRYRCIDNCHKTDSRKLELNYRICTHPDISKTDEFTVHRDGGSTNLHLTPRSRRKRALKLIPMWQTEPEGVSLNQGRQIDLFCSIASVSPNVQYQWYYSSTFPSNLGDTLSEHYNGIDGSTGHLSISSAASPDAGYYQCKVTDITPSGTHIIWSNIVQVEINNYYLKSPSDNTMETAKKSSFKSKDIMVLECPPIESNPPAEITWYKEDTLYSDQSGFIAPFDTEFTYNAELYTVKKNSLVLTDVGRSDAGKYKCRGTNPKTLQHFDLKEYTINIMSDGSLGNNKPFIIKNSDLEGDQGTSVTMYCLGIGQPSAISYTWTKEDVPMDFDSANSRFAKSDFGRKVVISNLEEGDKALYKCTAENTEGDSQAFYQVLVTTSQIVSSVTIIKSPGAIYTHDVYSSNPDPIFIPCEVEGARQTRFLRNGVLLPSSDRYTFEPNKGITFKQYDSSDSGVYQCVGFNSKYWKQKMTFVMITEKVTAKASADVTLKDTNATLSCAVGGYPYPDVTWQRDGVTISNTDSSQSPYVLNEARPSGKHLLVIKDIGFTDGGVYKCTATSRTIDGTSQYQHSASSEVTLTIEQRVTISPSQESVTATVGDSFTLECGAYGKPTPSEVNWYVNGTKIKNSDKYIISTKQANEYSSFSKLIITPLIISDAGIYQCSASNVAVGKASQVSANIDVKVKYLKVTADDIVREIASGDAVTITCSAQGSPVPELIKWYIGSSPGIPITSGQDGFTITKAYDNTIYNSTLIVASQTRNQNYVCEGINYLSNTAQVDSVKVIVAIYAEIQASRTTSAVETVVEQSATLTCYCSGVPLPDAAVWTKGGVTVTSDSSKTITNSKEYDPEFKLTSSLVFNSPTPTDIGEYRCSCENAFQEKVHTSSITINLLVVIPAKLYWDKTNPKTVEFGTILKLTCTATGLPRPSKILWNRQTTDKMGPISGSRFSTNKTIVNTQSIQSVLTILNTEYEDDGSYNCYTDNKINDMIYSRNVYGTLLIYQNPEVKITPNEHAAAPDSSIELSCVVSSKPPPDRVEWFYPETTKLGNQPVAVKDGFQLNSTYPITKVTGNTEGKYTCKGSHTYEGVEKTGAGHAYVRLYRPYSVSLTTSPPSVTTVNENSRFNITCIATGVPEVSKFMWTVESSLLDSDRITSKVGTLVTEVDYESDVTITVTSTLVMDPVRYTNLGSYKCSTSQSWQGKTTIGSPTVSLSVKFEARLFSGSGSTEIIQDVGSQVRLICKAVGNPAPVDIRWRWNDGSSISDTDDGYTISNNVVSDIEKTSTLQLQLLPSYHEKDLECISSNSLSAQPRKLLFTLKMNKDTMSIIASGSELIGETVTFACLTTYRSGILSWYKGGAVLEKNNRITFTTNTTYSTKNSVLIISDLDNTVDSGNYSCVLRDGVTTVKTNYILSIMGGAGQKSGMSTGIIIALVVLCTVIVIVIILIVVVFVHGRRRKGGAGFREKPIPGYQNDAFDSDRNNLQSVISMPEGTMGENLPKVVEPIVLCNNEADHNMKVATIARQATLTGQRPRMVARTLDRDVAKRGKLPGETRYTLDHRDKRDWY